MTEEERYDLMVDEIYDLKKTILNIRTILKNEGFDDIESMIAKYKKVLFDSNGIAMYKDAQIEFLTAENAELKRQNSSWGEYVADKDKALDRAEAENAELKRRLGAAIEDLNSYGATCFICKKSKECDHEPEDGCFEWRDSQREG